MSTQSAKEATVFDLRAEVEMRLHSDKLARELALAKQREEGGEESIVDESTPPLTPSHD